MLLPSSRKLSDRVTCESIFLFLTLKDNCNNDMDTPEKPKYLPPCLRIVFFGPYEVVCGSNEHMDEEEGEW